MVKYIETLIEQRRLYGWVPVAFIVPIFVILNVGQPALYYIVCPWANLHMSTESRVHVPSLEHTRGTAYLLHTSSGTYT